MWLVDILKPAILLCFIFLSVVQGLAQRDIYSSQKGKVSFKSDAPLEIIKAESQALVGVIDPVKKEFSFSLKIVTFHGFNSDIQRVHFLEDYMEDKIYPTASFKGKLIEDVPFDTPGTYEVRAKGDLEIHGIKKERIIKGTITITPGGANLISKFSVPLTDHGITIPKIVKQKIAEQIAVTINIDFVKNSTKS